MELHILLLDLVKDGLRLPDEQHAPNSAAAILNLIAKPDWKACDRDDGSWTHFIRDPIRERWGEMALETKLMLYATAYHAGQHREFMDKG